MKVVELEESDENSRPLLLPLSQYRFLAWSSEARAPGDAGDREAGTRHDPNIDHWTERGFLSTLPSQGRDSQLFATI